MPDPVDPNRTAAAPQDQHASASGNTDETAAATSPAGTGPAPLFGPPAGAGEVGTLGPYRVLKELGKGGMGAVYLALDTRLDRKLAFKVMLPEFAADKSAKERFLREARAAAKISHDNVVTVFEADERDGVPYIAMQYLQGYPLDEYLKQRGAPALPHVLRIARETALGLAAAHALGLVHRDIKPANLWLEAPNGRVKVLDFGLAKPVGSDAELTKSGAVVGTPAYMSPEQARGQKVDHRTDLFSLGGVLYRLCTGKTPFSGPNVMAVLMALGSDDPTPVRELNPNVPEALAALIHQLLAKKPEDRPQTAAEVAKRLRAILEQTVAAPVAAAVPAVIPTASAADISHSMPVVVNPVPVQPPVVTAMHVSAQPESAFDNLDAADATEAESAPDAPQPARKKSGGKGVLIAVGAAVLLAAVATAAVFALKGKKGDPGAENKPPEGGPPAPKGGPGPAKPTGPLPAAYKNSLGMEFVKVPKGTGWLRGSANQPGETKVVIDQDFYLGKYEVTQGEWEAVTGLTPSAFKRGNEAVKGISDADLKRFPVEGVSWDDCQVFIDRLNAREKESGWVYRLPKEAEWEYACRGGPVDKLDSAFDFYFAKPTNTLLPGQANCEHEKGLKRTCRVGSYEPNSLGLHDMHGNVWEWCEVAEPVTDAAAHRMFRGGSFSDIPGDCRALIRSTNPPSARNVSLGLRLARVPVSAQPPAAAWTNLTPPAPEGNWSKLWEAYGPQDWKLQDGELFNANTNNGWIGTKTEYTDFEIVLEYKFGTRGNSGVFLRAWPDGELNGGQFVEVQLIDDDAYKTAALNCTGAIFKRTGPDPRPVSKLNEWNTARVAVVGKRVTVTVNGTKCVDADVDFPRAKGVIGLQQLNAPVAFRNVRVRDLSGAADRAAAEWVLSVGGKVSVNGDDRIITAAAELPKERLKLMSVNLDGTAVTDESLENLKDHKELLKFSLVNCKVTNAGLALFGGSTTLKYLNLDRTGVTDAGLAFFKDCKGLVYLNLEGTGITDAGLAHIRALTGLALLRLQSTAVTDAGLEYLKGLDKLTELDLKKTKVTAAGVANLAKALPKCQMIWDGGTIEPAKK